jgi:hypothetical protein
VWVAAEVEAVALLVLRQQLAVAVVVVVLPA